MKIDILKWLDYKLEGFSPSSIFRPGLIKMGRVGGLCESGHNGNKFVGKHSSLLQGKVL